MSLLNLLAPAGVTNEFGGICQQIRKKIAKTFLRRFQHSSCSPDGYPAAAPPAYRRHAAGMTKQAGGDRRMSQFPLEPL
jgi:hypothetical protein